MPSNLRRYQRIAAFYDLLELPFEYGRYRRIRKLVFNGLSGPAAAAEAGRSPEPTYARGCLEWQRRQERNDAD